MFLTVAIPVYNVSLYIEECLESILKQTEKDFEIILVDDGSSDGSPAICDMYADKFPGVIRVIHKEHSGSLLTRRICLKEAKGRLIYLMDSDDKLVDENVFKKIREIVEQTACDMVIFEATKNEITKEPFLKLPFKHMEVFEGSKRKLIYELFVTGTKMNYLWNKVFSRELVDYKADYSIYKDVVCGTDTFQAIPIVSNAKKIVIIKEVYYYYRTTDGSISRTFYKNALQSFKANNARLSEYLNRWNMLDQDCINYFLCKKRIYGCVGTIYRTQYSKSLLSNRNEYTEYLRTTINDPYFKETMSFTSLFNTKESILVRF